MSSVTGGPEGPARVGVSIVDIAAGLEAYEAILEALIARGRTGQGAEISISMFDAMAEWMTIPLLNQEHGKPFPRIGLAHPTIVPYGVFKTRDGADILISIQNDREWRVLAEKVLGDAALGTDEKFATVPSRLKHRDETNAKVAAVFAAHDRRSADEKACGGRHRVCARQRFGLARQASAFAPHHGRHTERAGEYPGAGADARRRRRAATVRSRRSASTPMPSARNFYRRNRSDLLAAATAERRPCRGDR